MNLLFYTPIFIIILFFSSCSKSPEKLFQEFPNTYLLKTNFSNLPHWKEENYDEALENFINSCQSKKTKKIYKSLCQRAKYTQNSKKFFETNFQPYAIYNDEKNNEGLLTGYYEAELNGSLYKTHRYKYPIYSTPSDLIEVDLGKIYPELKRYRLRGRMNGKKLIPYYPRGDDRWKEKSKVLCYVDSKIDRFFLEIQGSGRIKLQNHQKMFVGYANQNGHKYSAIGRYLIQIGALKPKEVSLQSIKKWLEKHPQRVDEVFNYNKSVVFFQKKEKGATGALGLELQKNRCVAVDRKYIPLGTLLFLSADINAQKVNRIVSAQDTGGAIKGAVRADLFLGYGDKAMQIAGKLKSPLKLWMLLPKKEEQ